MNRKIKAYQAIIYIVLFYLAAVLFLLGPGKLLEKDRLLAGAENPVGTVEVREDQQVQPVSYTPLTLPKKRIVCNSVGSRSIIKR